VIIPSKRWIESTSLPYQEPTKPDSPSALLPTPSERGEDRPEFLHAESADQPHRDRAQWILRNHPEIRQHIGKNPNTFWILLGILTGQMGLAAALTSSPWWLILLVAALPGAFASHGLWIIIHECTHNLVFRSRAANSLAGIMANLPHCFPSAVMFGRYHARHHSFLGVYELDADLPYRWEARLVGSSPLRKAIWLLVFPIMQSIRPVRLKEIKPIDRWVVINFGAQILFDAGVWFLLGPGAFWYLVASFFFSLGLHPLGARWIQEHYIFFPGQGTSSYYGLVNRVGLNIGHHNEHHDFPSVPWNRLPELRRAAPEAYDTLGSHRSWTRVLLRFLFDREITLYSRQVRPRPGQVRVNDETNHDVELVRASQTELSGPPVAPAFGAGGRVATGSRES
jgi:sphingolipid delta-4 desaturase